MGFFEQIFGTELGLPARAVVALVLVLALIALTVWLMRRFGEGNVMSKGGGRGRQQRLAVLDSAPVDARRRLVLIRRDNIEHLILICGPTDVVIEPNIVRAQPATSGVRAPARPGMFEDEEATLIPEPPAEAERPAPVAPAPAARPAASAPVEAPRVPPRPAQKVDPQYADMAQRLEAALRKPEPEVPARPASAPVMTPRAPEPRAPEPRILDQRAAPRAPMPRVPEAVRPAESPRAPAPEMQPRIPSAPRAPQPAPQPAPASADQAADVFASLEEEMASLLRPGAKKESK